MVEKKGEDMAADKLSDDLIRDLIKSNKDLFVQWNKVESRLESLEDHIDNEKKKSEIQKSEQRNEIKYRTRTIFNAVATQAIVLIFLAFGVIFGDAERRSQTVTNNNNPQISLGENRFDSSHIPRDYLTVGEFSRDYALKTGFNEPSPDTVRDWIKEGRIRPVPYKGKNGYWRIPKNYKVD